MITPALPHILFVSLNERFTTAIRSRFSKAEGTATTCDVREYQTLVGAAFMSPANSRGFMDGGIDKIYSQHMWPPRGPVGTSAEQGVERKVKSRLRLTGHTNYIDVPYLPVGSALTVIADASRAQWLIAAPTMLTPQPVPHTRNAYRATLATLRAVDKVNRIRPVIRTMVVSALCCGWGAMDEETSAQQIRDAYDEHVRTRAAPSSWPDQRPRECDMYFDEPNLDEQPDIYENADFKRRKGSPMILTSGMLGTVPSCAAPTFTLPKKMNTLTNM